MAAREVVFAGHLQGSIVDQRKRREPENAFLARIYIGGELKWKYFSAVRNGGSIDKALAEAKAWIKEKNDTHGLALNVTHRHPTLPDVAVMDIGNGFETTFDMQDLDRVTALHWCGAPHSSRGGTFYAKNGRIGLLHRFINGTPSGMQTDHIDRNGLNNCRSNLRSVTAKDNLNNTSLNSKNKTGVNGVSWDKRKHTWVVRWKQAGRYRGKNFRARPIGDGVAKKQAFLKAKEYRAKIDKVIGCLNGHPVGE